jgi:sodium/potassium/calcium exchanger 6
VYGIIKYLDLFLYTKVNGFFPVYSIVVAFILGCGLACLVVLTTSAEKAPRWYWMLSFGGFVIALNWIFLLANEMVGLLQALGTIFSISDAIMGLTIFAMVSNLVIIKRYFNHVV